MTGNGAGAISITRTRQPDSDGRSTAAWPSTRNAAKATRMLLSTQIERRSAQQRVDSLRYRGVTRRCRTTPRSTPGDGDQPDLRRPRTASPRQPTSAKCPPRNRWTPTKCPLPDQPACLNSPHPNRRPTLEAYLADSTQYYNSRTAAHPPSRLAAYNTQSVAQNEFIFTSTPHRL